MIASIETDGMKDGDIADPAARRWVNLEFTLSYPHL
jgi:hypothetical protein